MKRSSTIKRPPTRTGSRQIVLALIVALFCLTSGTYGQVVANYTFAESTEAYSAVTGTTSSATGDDGTENGIPIGFSFWYGGAYYTHFCVSTNAHIRLGNSTTTINTGTANYDNSTFATSTNAPLIAPFWDDNNLNSGTIKYAVTGTAPNRILEIDWNSVNIGGGGATSSTNVASFKLRLKEGSNSIEMVYAPVMNSAGALSATIGLKDASSFLSVTPGTPSTVSNATANNSIAATTNIVGKKYIFNPPAACTAPTSLSASVTATAASVVAINGSFTAAPTAPTGYVVVRTTTNVQPTLSDLTVYTVGTNAVGYIEYVGTTAGSWTSTGLTAGTTYYYWVFSYANGVTCSGPSYSTTAATATATTVSCLTPGTYTVGATGNFPTLTALSTYLAGCLNGAYVFELLSDYNPVAETYPITFSNILASSAVNTVTIRPATGSTASITSGNATGTLLLDGLDYLTLDGRPGGTGASKTLVVENTNTSGYAIRFANDATNNTLRDLTIKGVSTSSSGGVVVFSTSSGTLGNSNNTITNSDIRDGATLPLNGIYASGTAAANNINNTISNNYIYNFFSAGSSSYGINIGSNNSAWTITGNHLFQQATRTLTAGNIHYGIYLSNSGNNFVISNNFIGGSAASVGGTPWTSASQANRFVGIHISVGSTTASSIQGNRIANFSLSSTSGATGQPGVWAGIYLAGGSANIGTATGNIIGSTTGTGSVSVTSSTTGAISMGIGSASTNTVNIENNTIGAIDLLGSASVSHGFNGIWNTGAATAILINNNTIGNLTTPNSINAPSASTSSTAQTINGILNSGGATAINITNNRVANIGNGYVPSSASSSTISRGIFSSSGLNTVTGNTVFNLTTAANATSTAGTASVIGISVTSTSAGQSVSQNTVYGLSNTHASAAVSVVGIHYSGGTSGTNVVSRNFVYSLSVNSTSATADIRGINISGGTSSFSNNMVRLGVSTSNGVSIYGIYDVSGTNNVYHNTIYIGGTSVDGTTNTHAFRSDVTTNTREFVNNIFVNARSNGTGTGKHYAVRLAGTAANPAGLTSNYNIYQATGTGGVFGFFNSADVTTLAAWKTATGKDANSKYANPCLANPTAALPDLHLTSCGGAGSPADAAGTNVASVTLDFDGETRSTLSPVDIGADAGMYGASGLDLKAEALVAPNTNVCKTNAEAVSVSITNASVNPIDFSVNNATVTVTATGGYTSSVVVNTGTLAAGASQTVALPATANMATNGIYVFTSVVSVAGDVNPSNDTLVVNRTSLSLGGTYTVGVGGNYTTLTAAVTDYNQACLTSAVTFLLTDATYPSETYPISINANTYASATNSLTIKPSTGVTPAIIGANATALITLNGAKYVTFDGSNATGGTTKDLTLRNKSVAPTVRFINDAVFSGVKNSVVEGVNTSSTSGTIVFGTSTGTLGNSNNTIQNCNISQRSDSTAVPANAIYSSGTAGALNANNSILGCNIFNFTVMAVNVTATGVGDNWTVNDNHIYQPNARTTVLTGISILGTKNGHQVNSNFIGGTQPSAGGANWATNTYFTGITVDVGTTTPTQIQGNTIKNIRSTLPGTTYPTSYGIYLVTGLANISNNTIGSANIAERVEANGDNIALRVTSTANVVVNNNTINNFGTASNAPTGEYFYGLYIEGTGSHTISNNTISNITSSSRPDASYSSQTVGLYLSATGAEIVSGNIISGIGNTATAASTSNNNRVWGLLVSGTGTGTVIEKNQINNIYASSSSTGARADNINGIQLQTSANGTISNNMINLSNTGSDRTMFGILDLSTGATANYYFNTINIGGTSTGANSTYAFNRNGTATVNVKNNLFTNFRSGGTGFHVAMANTAASNTGWSNTASNNNGLYSVTPGNVTQWLGALAANNNTLAAFKTASGGDANSISVQPTYVSATDLHLLINTANAPLIDAGVTIPGITTDIDNQTRSTPPDIGADEFGNRPANPTSVTQIATVPTCVGGSVIKAAPTAPANVTYYLQSNATDTSSANPFVGDSIAIATNGVYYVNAKNSATNLWSTGSVSITITNIPVAPLPPSPVADQSPACLTTNITVPASGSPNVTYYWQGTNSTGTSNALNASSPYAVTASGTYYVAAYDANTNCWSNANGVAVVIDTQIPNAPVVLPSSATICFGGNQLLVAPFSVNTAASGNGTNTTPLTSTGSTLGPNPLQNYYGGTKQQQLFTASELTAMGLVAGFPITSLDIQMNAVATNYALQNLTVKIKHSTLTTLTTWEPGLVTVRTPSSYTASLGWSNIPFTSSFTWNGTDGIVLEINYSNNNGGSSSDNNSAFYTTTANTRTVFYRNDNVTATAIDSYTGTPSYTYSARNNFRFHGAPSPVPTSITWSPATNLYTNSGLTNAYVTNTSEDSVYAKPTTTTTYAATAHIGTCSSTPTNVTVTVNQLPNVDAGPTQTVCPGSTITLTGSGATSYTWTNGVSNGVAFSAPNTTTLYTVTGTDGNLCSNTDTVSVHILPAIPVTISPAGPIVTCQNQPVTLTANGPAPGPQQVITQWNFNSDNLTPAIGTGTAVAIGSVTPSFVSGTGSSDPAGTNRAWTTTGYPAQGTAPKTAGVQFNVSTSGFTGVKFKFDSQFSNTAANTLALQYNPDVTNVLSPWITVQSIVTNVGGSFINNREFDLSAIPAANNNPNLGLRLVTDTAGGTGNYVAVNAPTNNYGTTGTMRYDMVTFSGQPVTATYLWTPSNATTQTYTPTISGTYKVTVSQAGICSGVDSVSVTVNPTFAVNINPSICSNQTYTLYGGSQVNTTGIYTENRTSVKGCDSTVIVNLTVYPVYTTNISATICSNQSYTLANGDVVNTSGSYTRTVPSVHNCDSTVTVALTVKPAQSIPVAASICAGQTYTLPNGNTATTSGVYNSVFTGANGCDSTIVTTLTVKPVFSSTQNPVICSGATHTMPDGSSQGTAGTYTFPYTAVNGCDSTITVNLTVNPVFTTNVAVNLCPGQTYTLLNNTVVSTSGTYTAVTNSVHGCDSTVIVTVTERQNYNTAVSASICQGSSYTLVNGTQVSAAGTYVSGTQSIYGCDSVVTVTLSVNPTYNQAVSASICQGGSYTLPNGTSVSAAGVYTSTLTSSKGCDSVIVTTLTVNPLPNVNLGNDITVVNPPVTLNAGVGFSSYLWNTGATSVTLTVTQSGTYSVTVTNQFGCQASDEVNVYFLSPVVDLDKNGASISLFPNPTSDRFAINVYGYTGGGDLKLEMINAIGQVVKTEMLVNPADFFTKEIDVTTLASSAYTLRVKGSNAEAMIKVVIAR